MTAATGLAILFTQNAHAVYFAVGALASTLVGKASRKTRLTQARALKRGIKQPRPVHSPTPEVGTRSVRPVRPKRTYGMPSTHSTALAFYFFYLFPLLPLASGSVWAERAALLTLAGLTLWSRVELGYHTPAQVLAGTAVGLVSATSWMMLWTRYPVIGTFLQDSMDAVKDGILKLL